MSAIPEPLAAIIEETLGVPRGEITPEARWEDFEHDSLDLVELVIAIQEEFSIQLHPKELATVVTLGDLAAIVEERRSE
jgi:acyl carrier protein